MKPTLLMHFCCAPCGTEAIQHLKKEFHVIGYWNNPNIEPDDEHEKRKDSFNRLIDHENLIRSIPAIDARRAWLDRIARAMKEGH
ncbi:MAG: hypothetical protein GF384_05645, partial [Elusimicrobia bacterium]|nr:hypothetical protein [Elusimicrobiota bacterium]